MKIWAIALASTVLVAASLAAGQTADRVEVLLKATMHQELVDGDLPAAIEQYKDIVARAGGNRAVAATALLQMGHAYEKLGNSAASAAYERVLGEYPDQAEQAAEARGRLAALEQSDDDAADAGLVARRIMVGGPGTGGLGAPSPDGRFLSVNWGAGNVALRDLRSGDTRRLTDSTSPDTLWSVFSPAGDVIAYSQGADVRVVNTDGSGDRLLYEAAVPGLTSVEAWSPDGTWILALIMGRDTNRIAKISFPEGTAQMVKSFDWRSPSQMSISPDGRYIVYDFAPDEGRPEARDIFVMSTDWSREIALVDGPANDAGPVWTPDGETVLFVSDRGGSNDLWAQSVKDGAPHGAPRFIKSESGSIMPLGFTTGGDFYYHVSKTTSGLQFARYDREAATLTSVDRGDVQTPGATNSNPIWSRDGRMLAYIAADDGAARSESRVVVRALDSGDDRELTLDHLAYFSLGGWSVDGQRILVFGRKLNGGHEVLWLDRLSGAREILFTAPRVLRYVELAPDGAAVYYAPLGGTSVVSRNLITGEERTLIAPAGEGFSARGGMRPSPDGTRLAISVAVANPIIHAELVVIEVKAGAKLRTLPLPPGEFDRFSFCWTPDGEHILAVVDQEVWRVPVEEGQPELVRQELNGLNVGNGRSYRAVTFHPDGETLTFVHGGEMNDVWVLENLLPELNASVSQ